MSILYVRETTGTIEEVSKRLTQAHKFGVISVIDLQGKMREKGVASDRASKIHEVCNPQRAKQALEQNMSVSTALPCRISVYEEGGKMKVATLLPTKTLELFGVAALNPVVQKVETAIKAMIDEAVASRDATK